MFGGPTGGPYAGSSVVKMVPARWCIVRLVGLISTNGLPHIRFDTPSRLIYQKKTLIYVIYKRYLAIILAAVEL